MYYIISYLIGCFPSGMLIAKLHGIDITSKGSGNVGATNIARTLGKLPGIITLMLDVGKGIIAVLFVSKLGGDPLLHGLFVILGHCISIPKVLKGGKGAATGLGVMFSTSLSFGIIAILGFIAGFLITRRVSVGTICACLLVPAFSFATHQSHMVCLIISCIGIIITAKHHENIQRILNGKEQKFSFESKNPINTNSTLSE